MRPLHYFLRSAENLFKNFLKRNFNKKLTVYMFMETRAVDIFGNQTLKRFYSAF